MSYRAVIIVFSLFIGAVGLNSFATVAQAERPAAIATNPLVDPCPSIENGCSWIQLITDDRFGTLPTIRGMTVDPAGNTYLAGETYSDTDAHGSAATLIIKHDAHGELVWIKRLRASGPGYNTAYSIDVNATGQICLAGTTDGSFDSTAPKRGRSFIARYDTDGNKIWARHTPQRSLFVTLDSRGNCYALSALDVTKFNAKGEPVWSNRSKTLAIATGPHDRLYTIEQAADSINLIFSIFSDQNKPLHRSELKPGGTLDWTRVNLRNISIATDSRGSCYLQGTISGTDPSGISRIESYLSKYTPEGTKLWEHHQGSDGHRLDTFDIAVDQQGSAYLVGTTMTIPKAGPRDIVVIMYNAGGSLQWLRKYGTPVFDAAATIAVDLSGNFYLAGATKGDLDGQKNPVDNTAVPFISRNRP